MTFENVVLQGEWSYKEWSYSETGLYFAFIITYVLDVPSRHVGKVSGEVEQYEMGSKDHVCPLSPSLSAFRQHEATFHCVQRMK